MWKRSLAINIERYLPDLRINSVFCEDLNHKARVDL